MHKPEVAIAGCLVVLLFLSACAADLGRRAYPAAGQGPGAASAPIPFSLHHDNIVVDAAFKPGHPLPFVFDSGLEAVNIVTLTRAKKLGLRSRKKVHVTASGGAKIAGGATLVKQLQVGDHLLERQPFLILRLPEKMTQRKGKPPIAGFLGSPFMKQAVVCIDYTHQRIQRWTHGRFDAAGLASVPMRLRHGVPTIGIDVDGVPAIVVVDTANNGGVELFPGFVKRHHLRRRYRDLQSGKALSGSGAEFALAKTTARKVRLGPYTVLSNVPLILMERGLDPTWGIDGYIGFKVLSRLNPCLDSGGQRLLWTRRK